MSKLARPVAPAGVYLLTPDTPDTARLVAISAAALAAGVRWLQYRNKTAPAALRREQAQALRALTRAHGAQLIVNDDAHLAIEMAADGVHIGRDDGSIADVRAIVGPAAVLGVSAYNDFERARAAWRSGADYVAFGSMFASAVKPNAVRASLDLVTGARSAGMHVVAIGGIDGSNIAAVAGAGAHAAALISAVYDARDPAAAAAQLCAAFDAGRAAFNRTRVSDELH
jgi:thiamine-phosphate pyrophosphorylase